jgi:hypothetical protein
MSLPPTAVFFKDMGTVFEPWLRRYVSHGGGLDRLLQRACHAI